MRVDPATRFSLDEVEAHPWFAPVTAAIAAAAAAVPAAEAALPPEDDRHWCAACGQLAAPLPPAPRR